jgi:hypothetical protein
VLIAILLFGGSLLLYAPSLGFGFIGYDENAVLLAHPTLYDQPSLLASLREIVIGYFPREEPLIVRDLTWLVDARLFGFSRAAGYHLGNVLWNAADVVLLFLFLAHATRRLAFAGLVAALFALLAVHVEPVCWVMGRKDLLAGCFTLLALLVQSCALRTQSPGRRRLLGALVVLLVPLAILSKFSAIVLVVVLALHRLYAPFLDGTRRPGDGLGLRSRWGELAGLWPHALLTAGLYLWYQRVLAAFQVIGERGPSPLSLTHAKTVARLFPLSLGRTAGHVFATGELAISYLRPNVALALTAGEIVVLVTTVAVSVALIAWTATRRKDLAFFVLAFFAFMLPYANLEYIGIWVADRYAYLASLSVLALVVSAGLAAWNRPRRWAKIAAVALFGLLAVTAATNLAGVLAYQPAFRDAGSFWEHQLGRREPSMLAFDSDAKAAMGEAAAAEPGSARQAAALARASDSAQRGLAYYRALPWQPAPAYFSRERAHAASLLTVLGLVAKLSGRAPADCLLYHREAYRMMPSQHTALMLAQGLLDQARQPPADESLARESLHYFGLYLREAKRDPLRRRGLTALLDGYTDAFPGLAADVAKVAHESLP